MSKNVSILSLLSDATEPEEIKHTDPPTNPPAPAVALATAPTSTTTAPPRTIPLSSQASNIKSLVSRYQTDIKMASGSIIEIDDSPVPELQPSPLPRFQLSSATGGTTTVTTAAARPATASPQPTPRVDMSEHINKFQTSFQFEIPSKTSIMSIMNFDKPLVEEPKKPAVKKPLKKIEPKKVQKRKVEKKGDKKKKTPDLKPKPKPKEVIKLPPPEIIDVDMDLENVKLESEVQALALVLAPPDLVLTPTDLVLAPTDLALALALALAPAPAATASPAPAPELPPPKPSIVALNIPLLDPKNPKSGQSEVIVNVMKLAEDKYGWSTIHPDTKSAIDVMDDMIDDDDDNEEDEEDEGKKKEESLTEEQLVRKHEAKMNRKVGKYDYEDPFIDDDELQWEESISSTKEGFFVYWGPLIEERNVKKTKKRQ